MKQFKRKYYGEKKIANVIKLKNETYLGNERVRIKFTPEDYLDLPLSILKDAVSDKSQDLASLWRDRRKNIIKQIMVLLTEAELTIDEISYLTGFITETVIMNFDNSIKQLYGKKKADITLLDVDKVLLPEKYGK